MKPANSEFEARRDVAKGAGSVFLAKTGSIIELVTQPAYTWMFGLATYGLYTVLWSLVNMLENVADFAMTSALQRVLPKTSEAEARAAVIKGAFLIGVLPCLLLAIVFSLYSSEFVPLFNVAEKDEAHLELAIKLFIWALPLWATLEIATSALRACQAFGPEIRLRLLWEQLCRLFLAVVLWLAGVDTLALLIAHLGSLSLTTIMALRLLNTHCKLKLVCRSRLTLDLTRDLFVSGISVLPSHVMTRIFVDAPAIFLNFSLAGAAGANAAGLYGIARKLASIPQMVRSVFSHVVSPVAASTINKDFLARQALYTFSIRLSLLLALPTAFAVMMAADSILSVFVTGATAAAPIVMVLTSARGMQAALGPASAIQQVISHRGFPLLNSLLGLLVGLGVLRVTFTQYETLGVAYAVASGQMVIATLSVIQLALIERLQPFHGSFIRVICGALLACLAIVCSGYMSLSLSGWVSGLIVFVVYLSSLWLSVRYALPVADREALGKVGRKLKLSPGPLK